MAAVLEGGPTGAAACRPWRASGRQSGRAAVAASFVSLHGGSAAARPAHDAMPVASTTSGSTSDYLTADVRRTVIARIIRESARTARHERLARLAAARRARRQAAQQQAA